MVCVPLSGHAMPKPWELMHRPIAYFVHRTTHAYTLIFYGSESSVAVVMQGCRHEIYNVYQSLGHQIIRSFIVVIIINLTVEFFFHLFPSEASCARLLEPLQLMIIVHTRNNKRNNFSKPSKHSKDQIIIYTATLVHSSVTLTCCCSSHPAGLPTITVNRKL